MFLKIIGDRLETWSKSHTENTQMLDAIAENVVVWEIWSPRCVHLLLSYLTLAVKCVNTFVNFSFHTIRCNNIP